MSMKFYNETISDTCLSDADASEESVSRASQEVLIMNGNMTELVFILDR